MCAVFNVQSLFLLLCLFNMELWDFETRIHTQSLVCCKLIASRVLYIQNHKHRPILLTLHHPHSVSLCIYIFHRNLLDFCIFIFIVRHIQLGERVFVISTFWCRNLANPYSLWLSSTLYMYNSSVLGFPVWIWLGIEISLASIYFYPIFDSIMSPICHLFNFII